MPDKQGFVAASSRNLATTELNFLFELSADMLCIAGFDGYFKLLNPAWEKNLGYTRKELLSKPFVEFVHPDDRQATNDTAAFLAMGNEIHHFENRYRTKDGNYRWLAWTASVQKSQERIFASARDVTDLKVREDEYLLQIAALEAADNAILITNTAGIIEWVNPAFEKLTGYRPSEVVGESTRVLKSGRQNASVYKQLWQTINAGKVWSGDLVNQRKNGETYIEHMTITPVPNAQGEITHYVAIKQDVTAKILTTSKLKRAYEETENLLSSISLILIGIDQQDNITRWNAAAEQALGLAADDVLGKKLGSVNIQWNWTDVLAHIGACQNSKKMATWDDIRYKTRDGADGLLSVTINPVRYKRPASHGFILLAQDITAQRLLEGQLAQAQKLESVGQLAAGIAHEINTPIQFISDNIHFLKDAFDDLIAESAGQASAAADGHFSGNNSMEYSPVTGQAEDDDQLEFLRSEVPLAFESSFDGLQRVAAIIDAVRDFSHPGSKTQTLSNINDALAKTITVSTNKWKYVADVVTDFDPDLPLVNCFPGEINQVFLNIIVNAVDAISDVQGQNPGEKGKITISTRKNGANVKIGIRDTGSGIPESVQSDIFNPFFTTKEIGKGTGQGLSISHRVVVEMHGGTIRFETEKGKGTQFILEFPIAGLAETYAG